MIEVTNSGRTLPDVVCIGSAALDVLLELEELPGADGRVVSSDGAMAGGGPAATAAVALARLGVRVELVARVAHDLAGRIIREQLADEGVGIRWLASGARTARSALASAFIRQGPPATRALVALPARPTLAISELPLDAVSACRTARWVHVDHAGWPLVAGIRAMGIGTPLSVDGGNPIANLDLGLVDLYAPSFSELFRWTGARDEEAALARAIEAGARVVIATRGADGASYLGTVDPDGIWPSGPPTREAGTQARWRLDTPAFPVAVRSTLGAGDVYHGSLLASLVGGGTIRVAMAEASVAAALSCLALDGRSAIPDRTGVQAALESWSPAPCATRRSDA